LPYQIKITVMAVDWLSDIRDHIRAAEAMSENVSILQSIADRITESLRGGGTLYLCGNGGSAADAQHVAGEFVGRFLRERRPLPAVALTTDSSILTAIANDYGYDQVFARSVTALAKPGDIVAGISTSGKSASILSAITAAKAAGASSIGFTGEAESPLSQICDLTFRAPSRHTPRIQEMHILAWHLICDRVEEALAGG
jgi:D-sedoheptulose 7-phosphate isomerase